MRTTWPETHRPRVEWRQPLYKRELSQKFSWVALLQFSKGLYHLLLLIWYLKTDSFSIVVVPREAVVRYSICDTDRLFTMTVFTLETDCSSETDKPSWKSVKIDRWTMDKVRRIVHQNLKPFHFKIKSYYLSGANYPTDNPSQTDNRYLVWKRTTFLKETRKEARVSLV